MKRRDLLRHLQQHACEILREGGSHTLVVNRSTGRSAAVPRHREINELVAQKICRALNIPEPN